MARVEPSTAQIAELEDLEPYTVTIVSAPELQETHPQYGQSVKLVYELDAPQEGEIWDFVPFRYPDGKGKLGINKDGRASRLRALLNAAGGKDERAAIAYVDDETWEVGYEDGSTVTLGPGLRIRIRGENVPRADGNGTQFRVKHYRPVPKASGAATMAQVREQVSQHSETPTLPPRPEAVQAATSDPDIPW